MSADRLRAEQFIYVLHHEDRDVFCFANKEHAEATATAFAGETWITEEPVMLGPLFKDDELIS